VARRQNTRYGDDHLTAKHRAPLLDLNMPPTPQHIPACCLVQSLHREQQALLITTPTCLLRKRILPQQVAPLPHMFDVFFTPY
jgi:hypothetical protein